MLRRIIAPKASETSVVSAEATGPVFMGIADCCMETSGKFGVLWRSSTGAGHQAAYDDVLQTLIARNGGTIVKQASEGYDAVFHPTLDFSYPLLFRSIAGTLTGRHRTVALLLRPQVCLRPTKPIHRLKRLLFWLLKRIEGVEILTIVPFDLEPRLAEIASGWIHDPQLWDLAVLIPTAVERSYPVPATDHRPKIALLGTLDRNKGFDRFTALWLGDAELRREFQFVAAGRVAAECAALGAAFVNAGGILIDERISDDTMMTLYRDSFAVWCAYDPDYDQASGIFGRAFQLGVPAIVTEGSLIARQGAALGHPMLALPADGAALVEAGPMLRMWHPTRIPQQNCRHVADSMRARDEGVLMASLFGTPQ